MKGTYKLVAQSTIMKEAEGFFGGEELSRIAIMRWTYGGCFMSIKAFTSN